MTLQKRLTLNGLKGYAGPVTKNSIHIDMSVLALLVLTIFCFCCSEANYLNLLFSSNPNNIHSSRIPCDKIIAYIDYSTSGVAVACSCRCLEFIVIMSFV